MSELKPLKLDFYDIIENNEDDLLFEYCEKIHKKEDYPDAYSMMNDVIAVEYFPSFEFFNLLNSYYEDIGKDIEEEVRGYLDHKQGFLMTHGINYDWLSADLFGDKVNGRKNFEEYLKTEGYKLEL